MQPTALRTLVGRYDPEVLPLERDDVRVRLVVGADRAWDAVLADGGARLEETEGDADATLTADERTWERIASDVRGGMDAFRARRLTVRHDLHLGVGFLAATSGMKETGRLRFRTVKTPDHRISLLEAGTGPPAIAIHGLGATKASFLATVAALAERHRVIAIDLPGFGDSDKPVGARYDARWFATAIVQLLDALELDRAHLIGNSLGGRVALEVGFLSAAHETVTEGMEDLVKPERRGPRVGTLRRVVVPSPSCPSLLRPQRRSASLKLT
jgi:hypothetical protein